MGFAYGQFTDCQDPPFSTALMPFSVQKLTADCARLPLRHTKVIFSYFANSCILFGNSSNGMSVVQGACPSFSHSSLLLTSIITDNLFLDSDFWVVTSLFSVVSETDCFVVQLVEKKTILRPRNKLVLMVEDFIIQNSLTRATRVVIFVTVKT